MNTLWNDIRYAVRGFSRTPLFTVVAVLSLAFGIGANAAIFSLLDQVMLRLLPVKHPEQLVLFSIHGNITAATGAGIPFRTRCTRIS